MTTKKKKEEKSSQATDNEVVNDGLGVESTVQDGEGTDTSNNEVGNETKQTSTVPNAEEENAEPLSIDTLVEEVEDLTTNNALQSEKIVKQLEEIEKLKGDVESLEKSLEGSEATVRSLRETINDLKQSANTGGIQRM